MDYEVEDIYTSDREQREANRTGVLLAWTRYREQVAPFVKNASRLKFAKDHVERIIKECAEEANADSVYISDHLYNRISDQIAVSEPEKEEVELPKDERGADKGYGGGGATPPDKFDPAQVDPEPDAETDLSYATGPLLEDEARNPDVNYDLNNDSFKGENKNNFSHVWKEACSCCKACADGKSCDCDDCTMDHDKEACIRCGSLSAFTPVCATCNDELVKIALGDPGMMPQNPQELMKCKLCNFTGNAQQVEMHLYQNHPEYAQGQGQPGAQGQMGTPFGSIKEGDIEDQGLDPNKLAPTQPAPQDHPQNKEPVRNPEGLANSAKQKFNDVIAELANRAAAREFSTPQEEEIQSVASAYQLDPEEVRNNLRVVAIFGTTVGVNGQLDAENNTEGMTEVDIPGMGGRVEAHEALIPTNIAVGKVADDLGLENDHVYNELVGELGEHGLQQEYLAALNGDHRFYLPRHMIEANEDVVEPQSTEQTEFPHPPVNAV